ncbi:MAG: sulfotransferase [Reichenbachiella sp.]|uniref:sulfotransferase n=1 Tax=Reichenbachiella sp. TaxID=2184521 RepID=UPI003263BB58
MSHYFWVATGSLLFTVGLILTAKKPFFLMAMSTVRLLDMMLNTSIDENEKTTHLIKRLSSLLLWLAVFLSTLGLLFFGFYGLLYVVNNSSLEELYAQDYSSYKFIVALSVGGGIPLLFWPKAQGDYSDWSKLFHRLILDHYQVGKVLFSLDKAIFLKKNNLNPQFVIVSGLARSGTTALMQMLNDQDRFSSLSYANMPMLMGTRIWKIFYSPKNTRLQERHHKDQMKHSLNSAEAFDEYFFKVHLEDKYISDGHLDLHDLSDDTYHQYLLYQNLVAPNRQTYLVKNNNLILRYESLRKHNKDFKVILMYREPMEHASSLLQQHKNFLTLQKKEPFALEYMDWLGHHEFGLHHKPFRLSKLERKFADPDTLEYWLALWVEYYSYLLKFGDDQNLLFVHYQDFLEDTHKVEKTIFNWIGIESRSKNREKFLKNKQDMDLTADVQLSEEATEVYHLLRQINP